MDKKIKKILKDYADKRQIYVDFSKVVASILEIVLKDADFSVFVITNRGKTIESLQEKLSRRNEGSKKPYIEKKKIKKYSDVNDLAGTRVIFYLEEQLNQFVPFINKQFEIIEHSQKIDEEGYNADHWIVKLNKERLKLPEYSKFKGLKCEIQLTTVLFHAWSQVEHDLIYKPKRELRSFDKTSFGILEKHLKDIMKNHIQEASRGLEVAYRKFRDIQKGKEIFDIKFLKSISQYDSNNKIYRHLELLEKYTAKFGDKVPKEMNIVQLIAEVIKKSKTNKIEAEKTIFGELSGKTYPDIVIKCLEILNHVRYTDILAVFNLLVDLYQEPDEKIKNKVKEVLERLVRYDFNVLKQIGCYIQRKILDTILKWDRTKRVKNTEIVQTVAKELLQPSFEGASMKDYKTMVFHSGALQPTEFLKKTRKDTIDLMIDLYNQIKDIKTKIKLLEVLSHTSYFPSRGDLEGKLTPMITADVKYLVKNYTKIIFDKKGKIVAVAPVLQEIEKQLNWITQVFKTTEASKLLEKIGKDKFYGLYRLLVGDLTTSLKRGEGWEKAKERQEKGIEAEFKKINEGNIKEWSDKLNSIAKYKDVIDEWKFQPFQGFLFRITKERPDLAEIILDDALNKNKPLKNFIEQFLFGFRHSNNTKAWDKYVERIIKSKDVCLLSIIPASFSVGIDLKNVRKKDINLLSQIIKKEKPFEFLHRAKKPEVIRLNHSLIRALIYLYRKGKKQFEVLIISLIKEEKDEWCSQIFIRELSFSLHRNIIDFSEWDKKNRKVVLNKLVELKDLNYDAQILLLVIAKKHFPSAMEVFIERIKKRDEITKRGKKWVPSSEYDAIPYHFNNDLREYISNHEQYPKVVEGWVEKMTIKSSTYNLELAQLLQRIDGSAFKEILLQVIKKGGDDNLNRAASLLQSIDSPDFNICFEIIKRTDKPKIWDSIGGFMFNTGVVSGEYGIAKAHENKIKEIEVLDIKGTKKEIERAKRFRERIIGDLETAVKREKQRADEELKLRKLEFGE